MCTDIQCMCSIRIYIYIYTLCTTPTMWSNAPCGYVAGVDPVPGFSCRYGRENGSWLQIDTFEPSTTCFCGKRDVHIRQKLTTLTVSDGDVPAIACTFPTAKSVGSTLKLNCWLNAHADSCHTRARFGCSSRVCCCSCMKCNDGCIIKYHCYRYIQQHPATTLW